MQKTSFSLSLLGIFVPFSSHRIISNRRIFSIVLGFLPRIPVTPQLEVFEMVESKHKRKNLAEMSATERAVAGCRNPHPVAKPRTRYAVMLVLSRH